MLLPQQSVLTLNDSAVLRPNGEAPEVMMVAKGHYCEEKESENRIENVSA